MKILLVSHCFAPAKDGGSQLFSQLAYGLAVKGIRVEVITSNRFSSDDFINPKARKITPRQQDFKKIKVNRLDVISRARKVFRFLELFSKQSMFSVFKIGPIFKNLKIIFLKRNIDWVIAGPSPTTAIFYGWLIAKISKSRFAFIPCLHFEEKGHLNQFLLRLIAKADLIFSLTKVEKKFYQRLNIPPKKIIVISGIVNDLVYSFNPSRKGKFPREPTVLFLGAKASHKRIKMLIEAMKIVWQKKKITKLIIAGPETLHSKNIRRQVENLKKGNGKNIIYLEEVSEKKKIKLIDQATVLVNPSKYESFGIVFAEAWARKKPVIGADIPILKEVIDNNINGLLFKKNSPRDLAEKILFLIKNQKLAKKIGEKGYQKAVAYRQEFVVKKVLNSLKK